MIDLTTLTAGEHDAASIAAKLTGFLNKAKETLDVAVYDFALSAEPAASVIDAFRRAEHRGVRVRLLYNINHDKPIPVPPPPRTNIDLVAACGAETKAIPGIPDLMHHKYVVRDRSSVWTGSMNWTDDSWTREENIIVTADSAELASAYTRDFEDLWTSGSVAGSGEFTQPPISVDGDLVRAWFAPGRGSRIAHRIATAIGRAGKRVRICSPVITAGPILGTLNEVAAAHRIDLAGVFDATQMNEVLRQWKAEKRAAWKIPAFENLVRAAPFAGKRSTPYAPGAVHDYMHAKAVVADDRVFVGSYNMSHSGEQNAENVLEIHSAELAGRLTRFIDDLRARYPAAT